MRIFNSLSITYSVTRDPGYWLSKRQASLIANRMRKVLDLTEYQRGIVVKYLNGCYTDAIFAEKFASKDIEVITGFMTWYDAEYSYPKGKSTAVSYVVANLSTGSMCVFIHGGWKPEILDVKGLFSDSEVNLPGWELDPMALKDPSEGAS